MLEAGGYSVDVAGSAAEAFSKLDEGQYELVLSEAEVDLFTSQLRTVLEHAADVAALDLSHLAPTAHPLPVANALRPDEPRPSLDREEVLAAAPSVEDNRFRVPRIGAPAP